MPKPQWTTKEQYEWLTERLPDFTAAQEKKSTAKFFGPLYAEWFKDFPNGDPTAEQLAEANGDRAVAEAKLMKAAKGVSNFSHVELLKTDHEDIPSACVLLVL
jgi:hypothetical protein